jgi:hypothetical protein
MQQLARAVTTDKHLLGVSEVAAHAHGIGGILNRPYANTRERAQGQRARRQRQRQQNRNHIHIAQQRVQFKRCVTLSRQVCSDGCAKLRRQAAST